MTLIPSENEQSRTRHIYKTHKMGSITGPLHQQHLPGGPEMEKYGTGDMHRAGIAESTSSTPKIARSPSALAGYSINLS